MQCSLFIFASGKECFEEDILELLEGLVIAKAIDGDLILWTGEKVKRISHEGLDDTGCVGERREFYLRNFRE